MEESEKRKERLRAMRMEAASRAEAGPSLSPCSSTPPVSLANPMAHPSPPLLAGEATPPSSRFEFYTDPMSAFSGSKRSSGRGYSPMGNFSSPIRGPSSPMGHPSPNHPIAGPRNNHHWVTTPAHQFQSSQSPDGTRNQIPHHNGSWRSPVPFASPFSVPVLWNGPPDSSGGSQHPGSQWGGFKAPGFGRGGSSSPHSFSGRGTGWRSNGSSSGWSSSGRGPRDRSLGFYKKTMVHDPWWGLKPIIGNILVPLKEAGFWLPESATTKKPKIAGSEIKFGTQFSLAEYLADSFEEAVNDAKA